MLTPKLKIFLEENDYFELCEVGGKTVGLMRYFTTMGIVIGLTAISYERRYCYQDTNEAFLALAQYQRDGIEPLSGNWIKVKGHKDGILLDDLNPLWVAT